MCEDPFSGFYGVYGPTPPCVCMEGHGSLAYVRSLSGFYSAKGFSLRLRISATVAFPKRVTSHVICQSLLSLSEVQVTWTHARVPSPSLYRYLLPPSHTCKSLSSFEVHPVSRRAVVVDHRDHAWSSAPADPLRFR